MAGARGFQTKRRVGEGGCRTGVRRASRGPQNLRLPHRPGSPAQLRTAFRGAQREDRGAPGTRPSAAFGGRRRQGIRRPRGARNGAPGHSGTRQLSGRKPGPGVDTRPRHGIARGVALARGTGMKTIRILLADDHTVVRKGLRLLLESHSGFHVIADAADGREAVALAERHTPDVVVMDVAMPILNGIEAARQISAKLPETAIVFLSMHSDEGYVLKALKAGARAYLLKDSAKDDLVSAVIAVSDGKAFFSPAISKMLVEDYMRQVQERKVEDSYELLTTREREVLQVLAEGRNNKEAAALLNLSLYTVETHRSNIFQKLNLHNGAELILYAIRKGVIS